jgi:hypothetical protein
MADYEQLLVVIARFAFVKYISGAEACAVARVAQKIDGCAVTRQPLSEVLGYPSCGFGVARHRLLLDKPSYELKYLFAAALKNGQQRSGVIRGFHQVNFYQRVKPLR